METINIAQKLKGCPKGTELYSPAFGEVTLEFVDRSDNIIYIKTASTETMEFGEDGRLFPLGECMLFPSNDCRDWSKFNPVFPPFEIKRIPHEPYYFANSFGLVERRVDNNDTDSDFHWETKNYFNIYEQADYAVQKFKELLFSLRREVKDEKD